MVSVALTPTEVNKGGVFTKNVLIELMLPESVNALVPLPDTVTPEKIPLPKLLASVPRLTLNVTVALMPVGAVGLGESMSEMDSPANGRGDVPLAVNETGIVFTGASLTGLTVTVTVAVSVTPPDNTV